MSIEPGIHNLDEHAYHTAPGLSHTGARQILNNPARYHWARTHDTHRPVFDYGRAAHRVVLGAGAPLAIIDAPDWRTKTAKEQRDEARTTGHTPILAHDHAVITAMADQLRNHPIASRLFTSGTPEQSLFWHHPPTGTLLRARLDWLPPTPTNRRAIIPDYKTAIDASTAAFTRTFANYGYHQQAAWYCDGYRTLTGHDAAFVFVVQEKTPPFLVNVVELDEVALRVGAERNRRAIDLYAECVASDTWPGYPPEIQLVKLPRWAEIEHEQTQQDQEDNTPW